MKVANHTAHLLPVVPLMQWRGKLEVAVIIQKQEASLQQCYSLFLHFPFMVHVHKFAAQQSSQDRLLLGLPGQVAEAAAEASEQPKRVLSGEHVPAQGEGSTLCA